MQNTTKTRDISDGLFPINHKLAGLVPLALEQEQVALVEDIRVNGQREPILLWNGEIVDGRCRQAALDVLGFPIVYKELDDGLSEDAVRVVVKSLNTRRNLTVPQKIASAIKDYSENRHKVALKEVAVSWGVSCSILDNAWWILRHRPEIIDAIFNGNTVEIVNTKGFAVQSCKISAIYAYLRREKESVVCDNTYGYKVGTRVKSQQGKEWLYGVLKRHKELPLEVRLLLEETANYKFRKSVVRRWKERVWE